MENNYPQIQELLQQKADYQARLKLMPYDGSPEVKEKGGKRYIYIRKRIASRLTSEYVDVYSDTLYETLLRNARESRELKKQIRRVEKHLAQMGYTEAELSGRVLLNLDFARANMKANIYDQAVLEGVATTFPQTEDIIENGKVNGVTATDIQKILNLQRNTLPGRTSGSAGIPGTVSDAVIYRYQKELIMDFAEEYGIRIDSTFWNLGNLRRRVIGGGRVDCDGRAEEMKRYKEIQNLCGEIEEFNRI